MPDARLQKTRDAYDSPASYDIGEMVGVLMQASYAQRMADSVRIARIDPCEHCGNAGPFRQDEQRDICMKCGWSHPPIRQERFIARSF